MQKILPDDERKGFKDKLASHDGGSTQFMTKLHQKHRRNNLQLLRSLGHPWEMPISADAAASIHFRMP